MPKLKRQRLPILTALTALLLMLFAQMGPVFAQSVGASGLPLPRFASLGSSKINVRVGPGQKYEVAWIFIQNGLPIEIIQEFDAWRKIRDSEGAEGWIHKTLLSGRRTALVTPWLEETVTGTPIYARQMQQRPVAQFCSPKCWLQLKSAKRAGVRFQVATNLIRRVKRARTLKVG